jgi:uncharacterized protein YfaP (DUF2135 family)
MADPLAVCPFADCGRLQPPGGMVGAIAPPPPPGVAANVSPPVPAAPLAFAPPAFATPTLAAAPVAAPPGFAAPARGEMPSIAPPPPPPGFAGPMPMTIATPAVAPPAPGRRADGPPISAPPPPPGMARAAVLPELPSAPPPPLFGAPIAASPVAAVRAAPLAAPAQEVRIQIERMEKRVSAGRRRSRLLALGAAAALLLGAVCFGAYYTTAVLSYASLADLRLERVPGAAERLALVFRPTSSGQIAFGRADVDRQTQLVDRVMPAVVGQPQEFQWRVRGVQPGDAIQVTYLDGWRLRTAELPVPNDDAGAGGGASGAAGEGVLAGQIINAINKQPVPNATVRVVGTRLAARTDAEGRFRLSGAPVGEVPLAISADGFTAETFAQPASRGGAEAVRLALSPGLEKGQIRIVLTWRDPARDLDAHLEGPLPDQQRFHVYYHQQGDLKSKEFVRLDVDDQDHGGPETVTVLGVLPGTYRYFVHDYTNRDRPEALDIARSQAEVKVYQGGQTYRFRAGADRPGNLWDVCTIEVAPDGAVVRKVDSYQGTKAESLGLYAKRTKGDREQWIGAYGGTPESERAVLAGLQWLARHQGSGGLWSPQTLGRGSDSRCTTDARCTGEGDEHGMAQSGLTLLAFQAAGHYYFNGTKYSDLVRKGLDWMVGQQQPDGALVTVSSKGYSKYPQYHMYEHGIAAFALADACAAARHMSSPDVERYRIALQKAIRFIEDGQHRDGGWRYHQDAKEKSDMSVTGWQVLALKSAKEAGLPLPTHTVDRAKQFFDDRLMGENGRSGYLNGRNIVTEATTGVGMLGRQFLFDQADGQVVRDAADYLARFAEGAWGPGKASEPDYYLWYNCTLAMFMRGGETWKRWNNVVRDELIRRQKQAGCATGSWDPDDRWGGRGGRIYSTALAVLALESYYRYTPRGETGGDFEVHGPSGGARGTVVAPEPAEMRQRAEPEKNANE